MTIFRFIAATILVAILPQLSQAADEPKAVVSVDNKWIEASIVIDPALKTYPALYNRLLANGRRASNNAISEAAAAFKEYPDDFTDGRKYYFKRTDRLRSAVGPYISVVETEATFTGGAHPNYVVDTLFWEAEGGRFMNIKPFFAEFAEGGPTLTLIAGQIRKALAAEKKTRGIDVGNPDADQWLSYVSPKIDSIALAPSTEKGRSSGFLVYYSPYAVGPYAEGDYVVYVPWTAFGTALSPRGAALFGGERPADDSKSDERQ